MTFFVNDEDRFGGNSQKKRAPGLFVSWKYLLILFLIIMGIIVGWYLFPSGEAPVAQGELPLIRADEAPFKIKSQDNSVPGVEHQDKLIYRRLREEEAPPPLEHILPDSEPIKMIEQYTPQDINPEVVPVSIEELIGETEDHKRN